MKENNRQRFIIMISLVVAVVSTLAATPVSAQGGPVVLMGIDAEDGGVGGHGPIANYVSVVNSTLANVTNGGSNILVIGGNKSSTDDVTEFWNAIDAAIPAHSVVYVNGNTSIAAQSFAGFAMIAVVSSEGQTPSGGLNQSENDALAGRQADIAAFVNGGGGLLGLSQDGLTNPYAYLAGVGAFTFNTGLGYSDIDPTPEGLAIGITDALDVCCWHDEYITFPSFLKVLATNNETGNASAIGGQQVVIGGGSISGIKFNDTNRNGKFDPPGEAGLASWTIRLDGKDTTTGTLVHETATTAADGSYSFTGITPGSYIVCENSKPNWKPTTSACRSVTLGQGDSKVVNFGNVLSPSHLPKVQP